MRLHAWILAVFCLAAASAVDLELDDHWPSSKRIEGQHVTEPRPGLPLPEGVELGVPETLDPDERDGVPEPESGQPT